jgi:uncharacterized protein
MPGFFQRFMPQDGEFFVLFQKQAKNVVVGAQAFVRMLERLGGVPEQIQSIKAIEHTGDEITHQLFRKLNQTFITPFDREDIHELGSTMDDVIDLIDAAAGRFAVYRVTHVRTGTADLSKVLAAATVEVKEAVHAMQSPDEALRRVIEINRLENDSDRLCRVLIAQLFEEENNPIEIIKWKEILEVMETAVDNCEDVSNVIESVILKNA